MRNITSTIWWRWLSKNYSTLKEMTNIDKSWVSLLRFIARWIIEKSLSYNTTWLYCIRRNIFFHIFHFAHWHIQLILFIISTVFAQQIRCRFNITRNCNEWDKNRIWKVFWWPRNAIFALQFWEVIYDILKNETLFCIISFITKEFYKQFINEKFDVRVIKLFDFTSRYHTKFIFN